MTFRCDWRVPIWLCRFAVNNSDLLIITLNARLERATMGLAALPIGKASKYRWLSHVADSWQSTSRLGLRARVLLRTKCAVTGAMWAIPNSREGWRVS